MGTDDEIDPRKLKLMRHATTMATQKFSLSNREKRGLHKPRPVTLPSTPWDDEPEEQQDGR
jgi:hypothetical protein